MATAHFSGGALIRTPQGRKSEQSTCRDVLGGAQIREEGGHRRHVTGSLGDLALLGDTVFEGSMFLFLGVGFCHQGSLSWEV